MRPRPTHSGFINGENVIRLLDKINDNKIHSYRDIFSEMRPSNNHFISGENIISEMRPQRPGFITGSNVISEMRPRPTRPSYVTGSNVINEMKPRPTRPMYSPTPSPTTTAKPSITFVQTTSSSTTGVYPSYTPTTKYPTYRPTTARPVVVTGTQYYSVSGIVKSNPNVQFQQQGLLHPHTLAHLHTSLPISQGFI